MKIQILFAFALVLGISLSSGVLPATIAHGQTAVKVTGPAFDIVPKIEQRDRNVCHGYFMRESVDGNAAHTYVWFYYLDENKQVAHDEPPLQDLTVVIVNPDSVAPTPGPRARITGKDKGQDLWDLIMTKDVYAANIDCLKDIKIR